MPDTSQGSVPNIENKTSKPPGLMPKNLQSLVIFGIALLMVLIMALTGRKPPSPPSGTSTATHLPDPAPVNSAKVAALRKEIQQSQQESAPKVEAALLHEQQKQLAAQGQSPGQTVYGTPVTAANANGVYPAGAYAAPAPQPAPPPPSDPIKEEQKKRLYLSLFADNVALTYRKDAPGMQTASSRGAARSPNPTQINNPAPANDASDPFESQEQLLAQAGAQLARQEQLLQQAGLLPQGLLPQPLPLPTGASKQVASSNGSPSGVGSSADPPGPPPAGNPKPPDPNVPTPGAFNSADGKKYVVFEGTILEALLMNRLDGSFAGPVGCLITTPLYSHDQQHLLIPAGSKILGEANKVATFGQVRLAVVFHRLLMPDGYSINLDQFKGLQQEGATALKDKVNNHYTRIFGASLAIGVLGGAAQIGTGPALTATGTDRIRQGFGVGISESAERILDRFLNVLPTVTIREGTRVKVYLANDLLLPDYNAHTVQSNL